jgi:hypothetical protein
VAECEIIRDLAVDKQQRELFAKIVPRLKALKNQLKQGSTVDLFLGRKTQETFPREVDGRRSAAARLLWQPWSSRTDQLVDVGGGIGPTRPQEHFVFLRTGRQPRRVLAQILRERSQSVPQQVRSFEPATPRYHEGSRWG